MNGFSHDILDAALDYAQRGWSVIPIGPGTKQPPRGCKWKPYQNTAPAPAQLEAWFGHGSAYGLAVVLGAVSGNLVCRDFDDLGGYETWATGSPDLAGTLPTVDTARGRHVYLRSARLKSRKLADGEYRAAGNYVLLPPTKHPTGAVYTWTVPLPAGEVPLIDPVESGLLAVERPDQRNQIPARHDRNAIGRPKRGLTQRTHRFLKIGAADGHRNSELFCAACDMRANGIAENEADRILLEACGRCQPSYPTNEALPTIRSAYRQARNPARTSEDPWATYSIPRYVAQRRDLTVSDKLIWSALDYRQRDKDNCFPSLARIAEDVGVNRDTACTSIKRLEEKRLLTVQRAFGETSRYTTHLPEIPTGAEEDEKHARDEQPAGKPDTNNHEGWSV